MFHLLLLYGDLLSERSVFFYGPLGGLFRKVSLYYLIHGNI